MKKMNRKNKIATAAAIVLSLSLLSGCVSAAPSAPVASGASSQGGQTVGTILLSVNPEIEIDYDLQGLVRDVEGKNEDGKKVVQNYTDYAGKECQTVVSELVEEIYQEGYLNSTIDGHAKNIVVKLEEGSKYPDDAFLEEMAQGVRSTVEAHQLGSSAMTVDESDYTSNGYIGLEKAKELVLAQLGLDEAQFTEKDYELDDGVYELEFTAGGTEYDFEVNAVTGKIMKADYENNDDWGRTGTSGTSSSQGSDIGVEKAKEIALNQAGVSASQVTLWEKAKRDGNVYDIEFKANGKEYDFEIHATSGQVLEYDNEWDDDVQTGTANSGNTSGNTGSSNSTSGSSTSNNTSSSTSNSNTSSDIGVEKAKQIALSHAGVKASAVTRWEKAKRDGNAYDIEFKANGKEYDYEIHATSGKVLEYDHEWDDDAYTGTNNSGNTSGNTGSSNSNSNNNTSSDIGVEKAKQIALSQAGVSASQVTLWEKAKRDGNVYDIEFRANGMEYDFEIHATSGKVLEYNKEQDDDYYAGNGSGNSNSQSGNIGTEKAKQIALSHAGVSAGQVTRWEKVELDDGAYDVEFKANGMEYSFEIHATSGKVLEYDCERDD